ncbi:MAG: VCBS repeat-containing protein [Bryobacterales bacterium]
MLAEDVDGDGKTDVLAINETTANWWSNPDWQRHIVLDGETEKDNVAFAAYDIDRDGKLDLALGAAWRPSDTQGGGTLQWIGPKGDPKAAWTLHPIGAEPTLHRIRWADVDGDSKKELLVAPLHGRGTSGPKHWEGAGARLLILRPPDWSEEVADDTFHILHNFWPVNFDDDPADEILTASYEGVHLLDRSASGKWTRIKLGEGYQGADIRGAGEIKLGRLKNGKRYIATVEPWHANHIVIYEEPANPRSMWKRRAIADELGGGHALWTADMDGDGDEELVVGWRLEGKGDFAKPGVAIFDPGDWKYQMVDSGGMATEDLTVADFNEDGKPDIAAVGRATHNVKIYWQQ